MHRPRWVLIMATINYQQFTAALAAITDVLSFLFSLMGSTYILNSPNFLCFRLISFIFCCRPARWDCRREQVTCRSSVTTETRSGSRRPPTWASRRTSWTAARARPRWVSTARRRPPPRPPTQPPHSPSAPQSGDAWGPCSPPQVPATSAPQKKIYNQSI